MDRFQWTLRVSSTGPDRATAFARKHSFEVGAPAQFDEEYGRITALEYVLGAVGADLVVGFERQARLARLDVDRVEAVVNGELDDPSAVLGVVGAQGHPGLARVTVKVYVSSVDAVDAVRTVWQETLRRSPLARTLRDAVTLEIDFKVAI